MYYHLRKEWLPSKWVDLKPGQLIKVEKDTEFPTDMFLLQSAKESGIAYVDTLNLDGESSLKEKNSVAKL